MKKRNESVVICPPCGEQPLAPEGFNPGVALATKRGANKVSPILPLLPRLTAVLPQSGKSLFYNPPLALRATSPTRGEDNEAMASLPQGREITACGFTLIELLVVVLIIGILAAVAVPQYKKAVYKSRYANLKTLAASIAQAEEAYYLANGQYATKLEDLDIDLPGGKTDESTDTRYVYDEGWSCSIDGGLSAQVGCFNQKIDMGYQQRFNRSSYANRRHCIVDKTTDITDMRNEICRAETGAPNGDVSETYNVITWVYQ